MRNVSKLACLMMIAAGSAMAVPQLGNRGDELPQATSQLLAQYPGTHIKFENGGIATIYGMPMTDGANADQAAMNFIALHKDALGVPNVELRFDGAEDVDHGRFRVYTFKQSIGGIDVEFGFARVVVLVDRPNGRPAVVSIGAKLAQGDADSIKADTVNAQQALAFAKNIDQWKALPVWSQPELVVFYGDGDLGENITPIRAWKFVGEQPQIGFNADTRLKHTFFVDAAGSGLKAVRNEVCTVDVTGQVQAWATPGSTADHAGNPPVLTAFPWLNVGIAGPTTYTNAAGNFVVANSGSSAVTVQTNLDSSFGTRWTYINNTNGTGLALTASASVTPPGPANLVLNVGPSEFFTAQVNTLIAADVAHDFIKDRAPSFTALDARLPSNVNSTSTCNAFYDGASINFYRSGGGCNNTGFSSVAAHEYGHHIVNRRGLAQNSFGEGFGDCIGMLAYNDPVVGRYFLTNGGAVRTPDTANIPVPCTGTQEIHNCGQQLPGMWWEVKKNFDTKYGAAGLERTRQLFVNWYLITTGGISTYQAIGETTAIEVLTVNDDDGNINNGTPDYNEIRNAFCAHNVSSPVLNTTTISFPNGVPAIVSPGAAGTAISFTAVPGNSTVTSNSGHLYYRPVGTTFYFSAPTVQTSVNNFTATIPAIACSSNIEFYFQVGTNNGNVVSPASTCTGSTLYTALSSYGNVTTFSDDFETNQGWTYGAAGDTATTGMWERAVPQATAAQTGSDHTPGTGTMCAVTGATANLGSTTGVGANDVDGATGTQGATTLTSPVINLAGKTNVYVSYWRWFSNNQGSNPNTQTFRVDISNDNGATWTNFETVGPTTQNAGGWINKNARMDVGSLPPMTSQMKFRFVANDAIGAVVEAAVDDFQVYSLGCTPPCPADFNGDNTLDFFDYLDFVDAFSANNASADFNGDQVIDFFDYLDFVDAFSAGC